MGTEVEQCNFLDEHDELHDMNQDAFGYNFQPFHNSAAPASSHQPSQPSRGTDPCALEGAKHYGNEELKAHQAAADLLQELQQEELSAQQFAADLMEELQSESFPQPEGPLVDVGEEQSQLLQQLDDMLAANEREALRCDAAPHYEAASMEADPPLPLADAPPPFDLHHHATEQPVDAVPVIPKEDKQSEPTALYSETEAAANPVPEPSLQVEEGQEEEEEDCREKLVQLLAKVEVPQQPAQAQAQEQLKAETAEAPQSPGLSKPGFTVEEPVASHPWFAAPPPAHVPDGRKVDLPFFRVEPEEQERMMRGPATNFIHPQPAQPPVSDHEEEYFFSEPPEFPVHSGLRSRFGAPHPSDRLLGHHLDDSFGPPRPGAAKYAARTAPPAPRLAPPSRSPPLPGSFNRMPPAGFPPQPEGPGGMAGLLTSPWLPRILKLLGWLIWLGKNFYPWMVGFISCYVFVMLWHGPEGIVREVAPHAGFSLCMMTCTGCLIYLFEYFEKVWRASRATKMKRAILERAPDLD